jgi:hypothetical protein
MSVGDGQPPSIAAESKRVAITDPAKVDTDFTYQGEYLGTVYQAVGGAAKWDCRSSRGGTADLTPPGTREGCRVRGGTRPIGFRSAARWTTAS